MKPHKIEYWCGKSFDPELEEKQAAILAFAKKIQVPMQELEKVRRVIQRKVPSAPHQVLLVIDATTGQNAYRQAEVFHEAVGVDGLVLSKYDSTAKGGILVPLCRDLHIPVAIVGLFSRENMSVFSSIPLEPSEKLIYNRIADIHGNQSSLIDVGDVAHDAGAELRSAFHPAEHGDASGSRLLVRRKRVLIVCGSGAVFTPLALVGERSHVAVALLNGVVIGVCRFPHLVARNALGSADFRDQAGPRLD